MPAPATDSLPVHRPLANDERAFALENLNLAKFFAQRRARLMTYTRGFYLNAFIHNQQFYDELIGAACYGLCVAASRFDPRQSQFGTYAPFWINRYINEACREAELGVGSKTKGGKYVQRQRPVLFCEFNQLNSGRDCSEVFDVWDDRADGSEDDEIRRVTPELIALLGFYLSERESRLLRWWLFDEMTFDEIRAREGGVTRQCVQQIVSRALKKLREEPVFLRGLNRLADRHRQEVNATEMWNCNLGRRMA